MPHQYEARRAARRETLHEARTLDGRLANARLAVFCVLLVVAWLSLISQWFSAAWMAAPLALFVYLVIRHHRAGEARERAERAVAFYERGLARVEDRWAGQGNAGEQFVDPRHCRYRKPDPIAESTIQRSR